MLFDNFVCYITREQVDLTYVPEGFQYDHEICYRSFASFFQKNGKLNEILILRSKTMLNFKCHLCNNTIISVHFST